MVRIVMGSSVAASSLLGIAVAFAGEQAETKKLPPNPPPFLKLDAKQFVQRFDKDGDGFLSKSELPPRAAPFFERADLNGDGKLDVQEVEKLLVVLRKRFGQAGNAPAGKPEGGKPAVDRLVTNFLERMDTNGDGKISKDEARGPLLKNFERFDTNKDGFLDKDELRRAAELVSAKQGKAAGKAEPPAGAGPPAMNFNALDRNADGRLGRDELQGTPFADQFDEIDTNKDGTIDRKEWAAFLKKRAEKGAP
jgi:Ca2+-binding EF-hand superfamily protein